MALRLALQHGLGIQNLIRLRDRVRPEVTDREIALAHLGMLMVASQQRREVAEETIVPDIELLGRLQDALQNNQLKAVDGMVTDWRVGHAIAVGCLEETLQLAKTAVQRRQHLEEMSAHEDAWVYGLMPIRRYIDPLVYRKEPSLPIPEGNEEDVLPRRTPIQWLSDTLLDHWDYLRGSYVCGGVDEGLHAEAGVDVEGVGVGDGLVE